MVCRGSLGSRLLAMSFNLQKAALVVHWPHIVLHPDCRAVSGGGFACWDPLTVWNIDQMRNLSKLVSRSFETRALARRLLGRFPGF
jgi:hypothetical protein